jgi:hypothetical protein
VTSEAKTFIQPQDLSGIEVECQRCHVTIFYPVAAAEKGIEIISRCSHCHADLFDAAPVPASSPYIHHPSYPAINDLQKIAAGLRSMISERTDIHANVRFRIDAELRGK